jgi:hypothetical protein
VFCDGTPMAAMTPCWPEGNDCATIAKCNDGTWLACKPGQTVNPAACTCS